MSSDLPPGKSLPWEAAPDMAIVLFWICLTVIILVYAGYPLMLASGVFGRRKPHRREASMPLLSVIVAAHNEEFSIEAKIKNILASNYPRERIEILIGSDGSRDRTEEIVRRYASEGVGLISFPQQHGKSAMQNGLVAVASGSILVFTDADCLFSPDSLRLLTENFGDPRVGLATARPRYSNESATSVTENEGAYLRYETWLRRQESERGILAMASGSLFAMRRSLWQPLERNLGDDFVLPLRVAKAGLRNVLDPRPVVVTPLTQDSPASMLRLKIRIISKDFRALLPHHDLLNPLRSGALAMSLCLHKLLRWLVPYFLLALFVTSLFLANRPFFRDFFGLQALFYAIAAAGFRLRGRAARFPISVPMSFCLVNLAALLGTLKCIAGGKSGQWSPQRTQSAVRIIPQESRHAD
jgi:cellulose synthase/poly-beta-1,6-N-acetylglucosamine synthase-like glycosyltransferase